MEIILILFNLIAFALIVYNWLAYRKNIVHEALTRPWIISQIIAFILCCFLLFKISQGMPNYTTYFSLIMVILLFLSQSLSKGVSKTDFAVFNGMLGIMIRRPFPTVQKVVITQDESRGQLKLLGKSDKHYFEQTYRLKDQTDLVQLLSSVNIKIEYR